MKVEFKNYQNIFEFIPCITYYWGKGGEFKKGTLSISWLWFGVMIYIY